jgi:hypothetical protein
MIATTIHSLHGVEFTNTLFTKTLTRVTPWAFYSYPTTNLILDLPDVATLTSFVCPATVVVLQVRIAVPFLAVVTLKNGRRQTLVTLFVDALTHL